MSELVSHLSFVLDVGWNATNVPMRQKINSKVKNGLNANDAGHPVTSGAKSHNRKRARASPSLHCRVWAWKHRRKLTVNGAQFFLLPGKVGWGVGRHVSRLSLTAERSPRDRVVSRLWQFRKLFLNWHATCNSWKPDAGRFVISY